MARRDEVWGPDALVAMIELYLNPNQDGAWEERDAGPMDDSLSNNLNAAEVLLKELKPRAQAGGGTRSSVSTGVSALRYRVLENYYLLATRLKSNVEKVMQSFIAMLEDDPDYLPAVLGMATGFMVEKNSHKARNLLKRVAKLEPSRHDGEDFSKANLLLAKFYVDKSKFDLAQDLCKRTLNQNKSSSQAWEILGLVMEKEQSYDRAAECYERAWKLEFEASAPVGFKLASCYMKSKPPRFVDAMDVCEKVLDQYPDYPRIREEILRKCMDGMKSEAKA
jgi:tetratricopeptide repeat protein 21B